jgi:hypothetical protein
MVAVRSRLGKKAEQWMYVHSGDRGEGNRTFAFDINSRDGLLRPHRHEARSRVEVRRVVGHISGARVRRDPVWINRRAGRRPCPPSYPFR